MDNDNQEVVENRSETLLPEVQKLDEKMGQADSVNLIENGNRPTQSDQFHINNELGMVQKSDVAQLDGKLDQTSSKAADQPQMLDTPLHNQGIYPRCAIESARMAIEKQTGSDPGDAGLMDQAKKSGNYHEEPVTNEKGNITHYKGGIGNLETFSKQINELPNVSASYKDGENLSDIKNALDNQHSVIVGVDTASFYPDVNWPPNSGGHAVVVTDVTQKTDGKWDIRVNDPNETHANKLVSESVFSKSWDKAGNPMIVVSPDVVSKK